MISTSRLSLTVVLLAIFVATLAAQPVNPQLYQSIRWRNIGPFRAGRTVGAVGIPKQPNVFFIGVNNGGVWKLLIGFAKSTFAISEEDGAKTSVFLASSPEVQGVNGLYFDKCAAVRSSPVSYDADVARDLWRQSERLTGVG